MALRPINYKKATKAEDKMSKKNAKPVTKTVKAGKDAGKTVTLSVRKQKKDAKTNVKNTATRNAVVSAMDKKSGKENFDFGDSASLKRNSRGAEEYGNMQKARKAAGLKSKTTNKIYAKTYKAVTKKISKANKTK